MLRDGTLAGESTPRLSTCDATCDTMPGRAASPHKFERAHESGVFERSGLPCSAGKKMF